MFPDPDGKESTNITEPSREPGFNWSLQATSTKNSDYQINPLDVISETQQVSKERTSSTEGGIYSDKYLDYEVVLTSDTIRNIRKEEHNYTSFVQSNFSVDKNSNIRYESPLLKSNNTYGIKVTRPQGDLFKCNNIDGNRCK